MSHILASREHSQVDQAQFAALSGDFNPLHVDPVAARRIGAGGPVVHGVHNLLWCLDIVGQHIQNLPRIVALKVNFDSFVVLHERVDAVLARFDAKLMRVEVRVGSILAVSAVISFGDKHIAVSFEKPSGLIDPASPIEQPEEKIPRLSGRIPFSSPPTETANAFPNAARMLGARQVAAITAFSKLIGMVCPGLHSVFNGLSLESCEDDETNDIGFRVADSHRERRRVLCAVAGGGWVGTLTSMMRHKPTAQAAICEVARHVKPQEFAQCVSLVVGGSRGIGEVAAKIIAAGGGRPIFTYNTGKVDAERVAAEIRGWGGLCDVIKLDINVPIAVQFAAIATLPNQLLYFATPMIGGRRGAFLEFDRLQKFLRFYVSGFYECCCALIEKGSRPLTALYPSTIYIEERLAGFTEYAMAKAAGEQLCRDMNSRFASFRALAPRLPPLSTDQNPELPNGSHKSVCDVMLPLIRSMRTSAETNS